mgnify:CR=1 FL=1
MKTKIFGTMVFLLAMFLAVGTVSATDMDWLQPASMTFDEPVDVNSSLKVTNPTYFLAGMHVGQQVVGGVSFLQGTVINTTLGKNGADNPVTIGDNLRVDGRITRGFGPVIIDDDLWVTKNIKMNPGMTVDGVDISALRISDWNKAYGWGDHSIVGYLTGYTEIDPIYIASPSSNITSAGSGLVVTSAERTNWNTAHGWGNHALQGYLTSETDPLALKISSNLSDVGNRITALNNILPDQTSNNGQYLKSDGGAPNDPKWDTPSSWHGSISRIKLLPTDFISASSSFHLSMDSSGRYINLPDDVDAVASISIPVGYQATEIRVDANEPNLPVDVYENHILSSATNNSLGSGLTNAVFDITDVNSTNFNYISIFVNASDGTTHKIKGGYVTIEPIPAP